MVGECFVKKLREGKYFPLWNKRERGLCIPAAYNPCAKRGERRLLRGESSERCPLFQTSREPKPLQEVPTNKRTAVQLTAKNTRQADGRTDGRGQPRLAEVEVHFTAEVLIIRLVQPPLCNSKFDRHFCSTVRVWFACFWFNEPTCGLWKVNNNSPHPTFYQRAR